ncbi:hypothetical protein M9Y10_016503 [Tritrichomonas musculus]|uniref:Uncharacterized protein n=1 Tax=Tritrichomonas musculus TaxID=1915356 RepID=A0ABR2HWH3_9EUKA
MGAFESYFPRPVSPLDVNKNEDDKDQNNNDASDIKDRNFKIGSTDRIDEDLKIFEKYLKNAISKELVENNNEDEIKYIVNQANVERSLFEHNLKYD